MKKFIKYILTINLLFMMLITYAESTNWQEKDAKFRMKLEQTEGENSLTLSNWLIPSAFLSGIKAYNQAGDLVDIKQDQSKRALIFPKAKDGDIITLYGGFPDEMQISNVPISTEHDTLTLKVVSAWRVAGNVKQYLDWYKNNAINRASRDYNSMIEAYKNESVKTFITPPVITSPLMNSWWDINYYYQYIEGLKNNYTDNLYTCRHINGTVKWRLFVNPPLRTFVPDFNINKNPMWYLANNHINRLNSWDKEWVKKSQEDYDKVLFDNLKKYYASRLRYVKESGYPEYIRLMGRELDLGGNILANYSGNLIIEKAGIHEFKVHSNAMWMLELNGEIRAKKMLNDDINKDETYIVKLDLKEGVYKFNFLYSRCYSPLEFEMYYRAGADKEWQLMGEQQFAPAKRSKPIAIEERDSGNYPLIRRHAIGIFMVDKQNYLEFNNLDLPKDFTFSVQDNPIENSLMVALSNQNEISDSQIVVNNKEMDLPKIAKRHKPTLVAGANLAFSLNVPDTIYDDEKISSSIDIRNSFNYSLNMFMSIKYTLENDEIIEIHNPISIPTGFSVQNIPVRENAKFVDVKLWLPGFIFGEKGFRIARANELDNIEINHDKIFEPNSNRKVSVVLKRMSVNDLRKWQLPLLLNNLKAKKTLFIGANSELEKNIRETLNLSYSENISWASPAINGDSSLLRSIEFVKSAIANDDINQLVIVPPFEDISILSSRIFFRYFSIIADIASSAKNINKVYIVIPDGEFAEDFRYFSREYGFEFIYNSQK